MDIYKRKRYLQKYFIPAAILALSLLAGFYFIISSSRTASERARIQQEVANEQARILQEEQERRKISKITFGYSAEGRPIEGYEIGSGANTLLLFGSIHGNEIGTADLLNRFVEEIKANPDVISKTKKLIVVPIVNPDGYYDRIDKLNANEVNLNLNFSTSDWQEYGVGGTWAGPHPFSETESQAIKKLVERYKPGVMIAYHARGVFVTPEANDASRTWARWYADKTGYAYDDNDEIWDYSGTATKWFIETTGSAAFTVEMTKYLESDWEINKGALSELVSSTETWFTI